MCADCRVIEVVQEQGKKCVLCAPELIQSTIVTGLFNHAIAIHTLRGVVFWLYWFVGGLHFKTINSMVQLLHTKNHSGTF